MIKDVNVLILDSSAYDRSGHYLDFRDAVIRILNEKFVVNRLCISVTELSTALESANLGDNFHIFILWEDDWSLTDLENIAQVSVGRRVRISIVVNPIQDLEKKGLPIPSCKYDYSKIFVENNFELMSWDFRTQLQHKSDVLYLPNFHSQIERTYFPQKLTLGFYGNLTFERGLGDLLLLAALHPRMKFRIRGYGFESLRFYRLKGFISFRATPISAILGFLISGFFVFLTKLPNVDLLGLRFKDSMEMSMDIQSCSAIFIGSDRFDFPSGVVIQSLKANVPVMWIESNSVSSSELKFYFPSGGISRKMLFHPSSFLEKLQDLHKLDFKLMREIPDFATFILSRLLI